MHGAGHFPHRPFASIWTARIVTFSVSTAATTGAAENIALYVAALRCPFGAVTAGFPIEADFPSIGVTALHGLLVAAGTLRSWNPLLQGQAAKQGSSDFNCESHFLGCQILN